MTGADIKKDENCCTCCHKTYEGTIRQKYCSAACRLKVWVKNNPKKHKQHQKKYNDKFKVTKFCRTCGRELRPAKNTLHRHGKHCSKLCARVSHNAATKQVRLHRKYIFHEFKKHFGCFVCGWNQYGDALDFHHLRDKKGVITSSSWATKKILNDEYKKCILVCKNCHYGLHHNHVHLTQDQLGDKPDYTRAAKIFFENKKNSTWKRYSNQLEKTND